MATLEIEGKLTELLPERSGEGRNGHWSVRDFVIEVPGQFTKEVAFSVWNNRLDLSSLQIGEFYKVSFDVSSRKGTTGGYFTSLTAWKIDKQGTTDPGNPPQPPTNPTNPGQPQPPTGPAEQPQQGGDDLPF